MSPPASEPAEAGTTSFDAFADVSAAVEAGAGLPAVVRAARRALEASVLVVDATGTVLAVAAASPQDERALLEGRGQSLELRVADAVVGELRHRSRGAAPPPALVRMVGTLIGLELERSRAPERATDAAVATFLGDVLRRGASEPDELASRGLELGIDLSEGASVLVLRSHAGRPETGDWRDRVLDAARRSARGVARGSLAGLVDLGLPLGPSAAGVEDEILVLVPGPGPEPARRASGAILRELGESFARDGFALARSRPDADVAGLPRAAAEALLAVNVAEAQGDHEIAFEETGSYRLLLTAMSEDPAELRRFHEETTAPLVAYDAQYETELVRTLESFLDADGSVANTAQRVFTHRHTVRYRLERIRELTGLDVGSTDGRERLGLGLKAMRVLGISAPGGPAAEPGASAGRVPPGSQDLRGPGGGAARSR